MEANLNKQFKLNKFMFEFSRWGNSVSMTKVFTNVLHENLEKADFENLVYKVGELLFKSDKLDDDNA